MQVADGNGPASYANNREQCRGGSCGCGQGRGAARLGPGLAWVGSGKRGGLHAAACAAGCSAAGVLGGVGKDLLVALVHHLVDVQGLLGLALLEGLQQVVAGKPVGVGRGMRDCMRGLQSDCIEGSAVVSRAVAIWGALLPSTAANPGAREGAAKCGEMVGAGCVSKCRCPGLRAQGPEGPRPAPNSRRPSLPIHECQRASQQEGTHL